MTFEGDLKTSSLAEVLKRVARLEGTGILTVQSDRDIVAVSFLDGGIVAADAVSDTMEQGLRDVLVEQQLVDYDEFAKVVAEQQALGGRLTELLIERRGIGRGQLLDSLRLKIYRQLLRLLEWKDGVFKLFVGNEVSYEEGISPISVEELLIRSMVDLAEGESAPNLVPDLDSIYERRSDPRTIRILDRDGDQATPDPTTVWLTVQEMQLLDHVDGVQTASSLITELALERHKLLYGLHRLIELQLIRLRRKASGPILEPEEPIALSPPLRQEPSPVRPAPVVPQPSPRRPLIEQEPPLPATSVKRLVVPAPSPSPFEPDRTRWQGVDTKPPQDPPAFSVSRLIAVMMAGGLALMLAAMVASPANRSFLMAPFAWQEQQRLELDRTRLQSLYLKIDRAVETYYLLNGHTPESLSDLVQMNLLAPVDLDDSRGRWLSYAPSESGYVLRSIDRGEPVPGSEKASDLGENFLFGTVLVQPSEGSSRPPLVLLD